MAEGYKKFEIVKDPDPKIEQYYGVVKSPYDDEDERTIIAMGLTEKEAYEKSINSMLKTLSICSENIEKIAKLIDHGGHSNTSDKFFLEHHYVKCPCCPEEKFCAMVYDQKEKKWFRSFR